MGNYKWNTNNSDRTLPYVVVLFRSRNKDNKEVLNFKERKQAYFRTADMDKIYRDFEFFASQGVSGETSRCYISLNARDVKKVRKELLHVLIDEEDICFDYIEPKIAGIAAKKENAAEKKWFFDFDLDSECALNQFITDIITIAPDLKPEAVKTPHGYAVIVQHGFDTRELLAKWGERVCLKRDDLICRFWSVKED